mmetsp:Transcript_58323/g.103630  ORF Transcript_58323/g.103630 Transcript_58323/m.103630 type:complete len:863 (+) Transcript_58323:130-2718(+)
MLWAQQIFGVLQLSVLIFGDGLEFALILDASSPGNSLNEEAVRSLQKGDTDVALNKLQKAIKKHGKTVALQNSVGVALMYAAKIRKEPSQKEVFHNAAATAFKSAVKLAKGRLKGKTGKARKTKTSTDEEDDLEVARANEVLATRHLESSRLNRLGVELDLQNRWEEAAEMFRAALEAAPVFEPRAANNLGAVIYKNATHRSAGWSEAEPLYEQARQLVERAMKHMPGSTPVMKTFREVQRLQDSLKAWRENADLKELSVPESKLRQVAVNGTLVCTWSGGGAKFSLMAINLLESIRRNAPRWEQAFVVMALDKETELALSGNGVTTWLYETVDIYMTRWRLLAGILAADLKVLLLDTDVVFLGDPFPHFFGDADFEVMTDHLFPSRDLWDSKWRDEEHINTGFMFARSTATSRALVRDFITAHHSPWASEAPSPGVGGSYDLFDQRIFARFVRRLIEDGLCVSFYEEKVYGQRYRDASSSDEDAFDPSLLNPSVRVHDPEVIAHGASFFWLRSHRSRGLQNPPVAHANFGRHKLYFMRDRGVWYTENFTERFKDPPQFDEYFPAATLPKNLFLDGEDPFAGGSSMPPKFLRYRLRMVDDADELAQHFLALTAALEVSVALGRRLILPDSFNCRLQPTWEPYRMSSTFTSEESSRCTFDFFADAQGFVKRFGHLLVEAGFAQSDYFRSLSAEPAALSVQLQSLSNLSQKPGGEKAFLELAVLRHSLEGADVIEIGFDDEEDVLELRNLLRQKFGTTLGKALWQCAWVDFEGWFYATRPGQAEPVGERACGVRGLDCCSVYHGWAEKLEYFTDVRWSLPCDCGVGAALGCVARSSGECLHEDEVESTGSENLEMRLRRDFGEL